MYTVAAIAAASGLGIGIFCHISYGAFFVWGICVGFILVVFGWLCGFFLPAKWALVLFGSVAMPIAVLWYVDEASPVHGHELRAAAHERGIREFQELFAKDPDAADSIAETLNLGLESGENDWSQDGIFRGIPRKVVKRAIVALVIGFVLIGVLAVGIALNPEPGTVGLQHQSVPLVISEPTASLFPDYID